jgi:hypothetical protein
MIVAIVIFSLINFSFGIFVAVGCCDGRMGYSLDGRTWLKSPSLYSAIDGGTSEIEKREVKQVV